MNEKKSYIMDVEKIFKPLDEEIHSQNMKPIFRKIIDNYFVGMENCRNIYKTALDKLIPEKQPFIVRRFTLSKFDLKGIITKDNTSKSWKAEFENADVTLKQYNLNECNVSEIINEVRHLRECTHTRVAKLVGSFSEVDPFVVMPICSGTIGMCNNIGSRNVARFMYQILDGLAYLHENKILHRNLNSESILLTTENNIVIAGFALAVTLKENHSSFESKTACGKAYYQCKMSNMDKIFTEKTDIFSLGVLCYEMATGKHLMKCEIEELDNNEPYVFYSQCYLYGKIRITMNESTNQLEVVPDESKLGIKRDQLNDIVNRDTDCHNLIVKLICKDEEKRPTAVECLKSSELKEMLSTDNLNPTNIDNDQTLNLVNQVAATANAVKPQLNFFRHSEKPISEEDVHLSILYHDPDVYKSNSSSEATDCSYVTASCRDSIESSNIEERSSFEQAHKVTTKSIQQTNKTKRGHPKTFQPLKIKKGKINTKKKRAVSTPSDSISGPSISLSRPSRPAKTKSQERSKNILCLEEEVEAKKRNTTKNRNSSEDQTKN